MKYLLGAAALAVASIAVGVTLAPAAAAGERTTDATSGWARVATLRGSGSRVLSVRLPAGPVVVQARHTGSSNFVVELSGPGGRELLVNEIGPYRGAAVTDAAGAGRYRAAVTADGSWTLELLRPTTAGLRSVLGRFAGTGSTVVGVRSRADRELVVTSTHRGESNFVVYLIGFGSVTGRELVVNEIGRYRGQALVDVPRGTLLLWVQADGPWTVRLAP
jgi:hypothetical protein